MIVINRTNHYSFILFFVLGLLGLVSCKSTSEGESLYKIVNDDSELNQRVTEKNETIEIVSQGIGYQRKELAKKAAFSLKLVAELIPPTIGAGSQATMVSIQSNQSRVTVSYNKKGSQYRGGLDILQITGSQSIKIRSSVELFEADANAVFADKKRVFAALATDDQELVSLGNRSAILGFDLQGYELKENDGLSAALPSFAATSVANFDNRVFVTSGNLGGLSVYREILGDRLHFSSFDDARLVDVNKEYLTVLLGDDNADEKGEIVVMDPDSYDILNRYPFKGANTPEAKNTIELVDHLAFIAAGSEGVKVMDLTNGKIVAEIPRPNSSDLGLDDSVIMTNAVSVDGDKIFISNGEAGIYTAIAGKDLAKYKPGESPEITMLGKVQFNQLESVNHVAYRSKMLVVAAGTGGVKIVSL